MMVQARQQQQQQQQSGASASRYPSYSGLSPNLPNSAAMMHTIKQQHALPYVTSLGENDVLLGRGTPCAENEGNVRFRRLVRNRKAEYIAAEKRIRKDAIAREILDVITRRGGKFLRKVESRSEIVQLGVPPGISYKEVWALVDEDTKVQKVKQALRNKDDISDLPPPSESEKEAEASTEGRFKHQDATNQLPLGLSNDPEIRRADLNLPRSTGILDRKQASSDKSDKGGANTKNKKIKSPVNFEKSSAAASPLGATVAAGRRLSGGIGGVQHGSSMAASLDMSMVRGPGHDMLAFNPQRLPVGLTPPTTMAGMVQREQELQRLRMIQGSMCGANPGGMDFRQMQAHRLQSQQLQAQQMAAVAAKEQALRQVQLDSQLDPRRLSGSAVGIPGSRRASTIGYTCTSNEGNLSTSDAATATARGPRGSESASAGERAIGIAQAMKRAEAFSPLESLELSQIETLIVSTLCSRGLPVWSPDAQTKAFVDVPAFAAKRYDWSWCDFSQLLKQNALEMKPGSDEDQVASIALEATKQYLSDPRELATKTIMLVEKLRRHSSAGGMTQRKQSSGLGMRVPLWLDRELSRWAMILGIADPTGRPVPFSSTDFVTEHPSYKAEPSIKATAAFDPQLADDVVDQVALLTRLRSVVLGTPGLGFRNMIEVAVAKADAAGEGWESQPKTWCASEGASISREMILCDRLLTCGFPGVSASTNDLPLEMVRRICNI